MGLLAGLIELIAPTRCAGCDLPGALLCDTCRHHASRFVRDECCPRCGAPFGALVCTECWEREFAFEAAVALGELASPLSRAVVLHKDAGERGLGMVLGTWLGNAVSDAWPAWPQTVTWIPSTDAALSRRGFDHARQLAEPVASVLGVECRPLLTRTEALDQRALGRSARAMNASGTFTASADHGELSNRVVIVDDVLTTGATLDAAAMCLLETGVEAVRVAVVARAW